MPVASLTRTVALKHGAGGRSMRRLIGDVFLRDAGAMGSELGTHALRVAVKAREQNRLIVDAIAEALGRGVR